MGGAFTAVQDGFAAWEFNPAGAGFYVEGQSKSFDFTLYFNVMGPGILLENKSQLKDGLFFLGTLVKGFTAQVGPFSIGGVFGEELLTDHSHLKRPRILSSGSYLDQRNSSLGVALGLGGRVSIGVSAEVFKRPGDHRDKYKIGYRYGVQVKTRSDIDIGLFFCDLPADAEYDRLPIERFADETLNLGVAYHPSRWMTLSLDIRNVSDENKSALREPHAGLELKPVNFLSLRGGYFRDKEKTNWLSGGIGLGRPKTRYNDSFWKHVRFDGTLLIEKTKVRQNRWWFFTTVLSW